MDNIQIIKEILSNIIEPDIRKDLVSADLVKTLELRDETFHVQVSISNPAFHARKRMHEQIAYQIKKQLGEDFKFELIVSALPAESELVKRKILPEVKNIIAVASGKGGVGKSTVTANLAGGLAKKGFRVGIVDADIYGPSIPTMFDLVGERPEMIDVEGVSKINPIISYGIKILSIGFFTDQDSAVVWRGPMAAKALTQLFTDAYWGKLDYLLIDLPPGTGDIHLSLVQTVPLDGVVIVSTPQEVALADARKGVNMFKLESINVPIVGLIENMSWFTPAELPNNKYYLFGRDGVKNLAEGINECFLGHIPLVQSVRESGDVGRPAIFQENAEISKELTQMVERFIEQVQKIKNKEKEKATA
ncbi:MAG: Mrp/NBP35 family ATP-binding protein [Flavobacteriia bacterium]|nr:Mrp/NBP35 family ATP-binding protein [Flavobacteriia bacterium]